MTHACKGNTGLLMRYLAGIPGLRAEGAWDRAWHGIRMVWASQFNDRALRAMRRAGLPAKSLCMAILCQEVLQAEYSFVCTHRQSSQWLAPVAACLRYLARFSTYGAKVEALKQRMPCVMTLPLRGL